MKRCNELSGKEWLQNSFSIWRNLVKTKDEKKLKHPASFPVSLCEKLIKTFSKIGDNIIDPFMGIGTTMVAAYNLNRYGVGIELSEYFYNIAKTRLPNSDNISLINGDSFKELDNISDNHFELCLTSPPYWNILNSKRTADNKEIVNYSDSVYDIGNIGNYDDFIIELNKLFTKIYRVLKPNSYCLVNLMDLRKKSNFYPLHIDFSFEMKKIGYILDDIIIWDRQIEYNNMRPLGYPYKFRINKVHEYILIFIKE